MYKPLRNELLRGAIIFILIVIVYLPTFSGEFILDDKPFVKENQYIRQFHSLASYFSQEDGISKTESEGFHSGYYRPLVNLSYSMDFKLWGLNGAGFRATNLTLHLITCLMLLLVLRSVMGSGGGLFWVVLFFGVHPANTESVSWVTSRNNIFVTLFCLASFYCHVKNSGSFKRGWGPLSIIFFFLALLSKEFALMFFPILILYDFWMGEEGKTLREKIPLYSGFALAILIYLILRGNALETLAPPHGHSHFWRSVYFAPFLILYNLRIIFFPIGLHNFMISYPDNYIGAEALLGFMGLALIFYFIWKKRGERTLLFSSISFLMALIPVLNIIPTSAYSLISMRWLYFPMVFLSFYAVKVIGGPAFELRSIRCVIASALLIYLGFYSFILNQNFWKTEENIFKNEVIGFKNYFFAADLAKIYHEKGRFRDAEHYFGLALKETPQRVDLYINYARLLVEKGSLKEALEYLERGSSMGPTKRDLGPLYNNTGVAHFRLRSYDRAKEYFKKAVLAAPGEMSYRVNLGTAHDAAGEHGAAIAIFQECMESGLDDPSIRKKMAKSYRSLGDYDSAMRIVEGINQ